MHQPSPFAAQNGALDRFLVACDVIEQVASWIADPSSAPEPLTNRDPIEVARCVKDWAESRGWVSIASYATREEVRLLEERKRSIQALQDALKPDPVAEEQWAAFLAAMP